MAELKTFIFTDIVRSVALKNEMSGRDDTERDRAFIGCVLTPHRERIDAELAIRGGRIVSTAGDGHFLVFSDTIQAALWAVAVQQSHQDTPIRTPHGSQVEVRISMHVGVPQIDPRDENNFVGKTVDYTARLNDFAQGGQILISRSVASMLDDAQIAGLSIHAHGRRVLRGIGRVEVHELVYRDTGPMETLYQPAKPDERQWTVLPTQSSAMPYPAPEAPGSTHPTIPHPKLQRLGNYELGELLGSGGMGDVYRARHTQFGRERAIKVIKQHFIDSGHEDVVRRFYQEIKAVGALEHPNIVVAIDSSAPADRIHYLVMEYIDGIGLDELVMQHGPLAVPDACEIICQAARGLAYIHRHGMVHRDIKPSNLMLTLCDRETAFPSSPSSPGPPPGVSSQCGLVKLLDLGLALLAAEGQERITQFHQRAMGTGMYMSPEQWKTTSVDIRADIYSLGCTLYHLLAGKPPFYDSDLKPEKAHEKSRIPTITGPTHVPRKLWDILKRMMAKRPEDRYQLPSQVTEALAPFCEGSDLVGLVQQYQIEGDASIDVADTEALAGSTPRSGSKVQSRPVVKTQPMTGSTRPEIPRWWHKPAIRWIAGGLLCLALIATGSAIWWFWNPLVLATDQGPAAAEWIATLPGLSGVSWFEESPWLFPEERVRILYALRRDSYESLEALSRQDDAEAFYRALRGITENRHDPTIADARAEPFRSLTSPVHAKCRHVLADLDPLAQDAEDTIRGLIRMLEHRPEEDRTAVEWHLLGVLLTNIHQPEDAVKALTTARQMYQRMMGKEGPPIVQGLLALCLTDLATVPTKSVPAAELFRQAREILPSNAAPCFMAYMLGMESLARLNDPEENDYEIVQPLRQAMEWIDEHQLSDNHPLRAYIHERHAHYYLETWHLKEAKDEAGKASQMRDIFGRITKLRSEKSRTRSETAEGYHFAQQAYFRDRQLQALAQHFLGVTGDVPLVQMGGKTIATQNPAAYATFTELLGYIWQQSNWNLTSEQKAIWDSLVPNFRGRNADCQLFLMGQFQEAAESMYAAISFAEELNWANIPAKRYNLVFMHYKRAIALSLARDHRGAAVARQMAENLVAGIPPDNEDRYRIFARIAGVLDDEESTRAAKLSAILGEEVSGLGPRRRDDRQLLLFVCQYLIHMKKRGPEQGKNFENLDQKQLEQHRSALIHPTPSGPELPTHYRDLVSQSAHHYWDQEPR
ncbi:MAG: protein kinase [Pirellulales bacterium]|nr:protein kinase [Pirellulales bacterium]